jgi:hypothetical protein
MSETTTTELTDTAAATPPSAAPADAPPAPVAERPDSSPETEAGGATILGGEPEAAAGEAEAGEASGEATVPEKYELAMPEGFVVNADALAEAEGIFRELGLTNDAANKLVPAAVRLVEDTLAKVHAATAQLDAERRKAWADEVMADPELGGSEENHAKVKAIAAKAIDAFAGEEFRQMVNESGLGNHPALVRAFYRVGKAIGEDSLNAVAAPAQSAQQRASNWYGPEYLGQKS